MEWFKYCASSSLVTYRDKRRDEIRYEEIRVIVKVVLGSSWLGG
jgi:hypothetical protein